MAIPDYPKLLTRVEAAAYLGVRPQTLATWASLGRYGLPVIKVGRCVRYRMADLERWLAARTEGAPDNRSDEATRE
jgi:excisionase family DNA binding protein